MTAFGKVLTSKSNHDEDFIAKRKWEKDWMNSGEDSDDNIQKKRKVSTYLPNYKVTHVLFLQMITYNSGILLQKKGKVFLQLAKVYVVSTLTTILGQIISQSQKSCTKQTFSQTQQRALVNDWFNSVVVTQHTSYHK